jgi:hypothetical protein
VVLVKGGIESIPVRAAPPVTGAVGSRFQPPAEQQLTPEPVRELIAREYTLPDDVVAYIRSGVLAARISTVNGDDLIEAAMHHRNVSVRPLREAIGVDGE